MQEVKQTQKPEGIVKTSVRLTKPLHKELKQFCLDNERTEVEVISEAVAEYIRNRRRK